MGLLGPTAAVLTVAIISAGCVLLLVLSEIAFALMLWADKKLGDLSDQRGKDIDRAAESAFRHTEKESQLCERASR